MSTQDCDSVPSEHCKDRRMYATREAWICGCSLEIRPATPWERGLPDPRHPKPGDRFLFEAGLGGCSQLVPIKVLSIGNTTSRGEPCSCAAHAIFKYLDNSHGRDIDGICVLSKDGTDCGFVRNAKPYLPAYDAIKEPLNENVPNSNFFSHKPDPYLIAKNKTFDYRIFYCSLCGVQVYTSPYDSDTPVTNIPVTGCIPNPDAVARCRKMIEDWAVNHTAAHDSITRQVKEEIHKLRQKASRYNGRNADLLMCPTMRPWTNRVG